MLLYVRALKAIRPLNLDEESLEYQLTQRQYERHPGMYLPHSSKLPYEINQLNQTAEALFDELMRDKSPYQALMALEPGSGEPRLLTVGQDYGENAKDATTYDGPRRIDEAATVTRTRTPETAPPLLPNLGSKKTSEAEDAVRARINNEAPLLLPSVPLPQTTPPAAPLPKRPIIQRGVKRSKRVAELQEAAAKKLLWYME